MPLALDPTAWYHGSGVWRLVARLVPGQTVESAERKFTSLLGDLRREFGRPNDYGRTASVARLRDVIVGDVEPALLVLQGTAAFPLLIAAINVAHLLLVQAVGRGREVAIRVAVGGGLRRVLAQLAVEGAGVFGRGKPILNNQSSKSPIAPVEMGLGTVGTKSGQMVCKRFAALMASKSLT